MIDSRPNVRASSETIGATCATDGGVAHQIAQQAGEDHGGRDRLACPSPRRTPRTPWRRGGHRGSDGPTAPAPGRPGRALGPAGTPSHRSPRAAVVGRIALERGVGDVVGEVEAVPQRRELRPGHLLDLMGGVARLDLGAQRPSLDRLGQDHRRRAALLGGELVGRVELAVVVPAAGQRDQLVVAQVLDQACAGAGRARRSAPGCRHRTRPPTSGTRRRPWCSSGRGGPRRRHGRAGRPTASPRSP